MQQPDIIMLFGESHKHSHIKHGSQTQHANFMLYPLSCIKPQMYKRAHVFPLYNYLNN